MNSIRSMAETRRAALLAEADRLTEFLRTYDELANIQSAHALPTVASVDPVIAVPIPSSRDHVAVVANEDRAESSKPRNWRTAATGFLAAQIIRELGPLATASLHAELTRRGHDVGGKNPAATLHSRLSRAETLEFDRTVGWRLKVEPRQTNETVGQALQGEPTVSGRDPDQPEGSSSNSAAVNPDGGGGI